MTTTTTDALAASLATARANLIAQAHAESAERGRILLATYRVMHDLAAGPEAQAASLITDLLHAVAVGEAAGFTAEPDAVLDLARELFARDQTGEW